MAVFKERRDAKTEVSFTDKEPIIYIRPTALDKMALYVQCCDKEIGWLGSVTRQDNLFIIDDTYLFKQEVNATTCEISPEGLSEFVMELFNEDPDNAMEINNSLKLWGHSHVNMGVSPSGQDDTQINTFKDNNEWFIRVIANKSGEMEFCVYDFKNGVKYKNVKWLEYREAQFTLEEIIKAEIALKVKEKKWATTNSYVQNRTWDEDTQWWNKQGWNQEEDKKKEEGAPRRTTEEAKKLTIVKDKWSDLDIEETFSQGQLLSIADSGTFEEAKALIKMCYKDGVCDNDDYIDIYMYAHETYGDLRYDALDDEMLSDAELRERGMIN